VHISELAPHHVESPREIVHPGDEIRVKILEIDSERRRLSLSAKRVEDQILPVARAVQPDATEPEATVEGPAADAAPAEGGTAETTAPPAEQDAALPQPEAAVEQAAPEAVVEQPAPEAAQAAAEPADSQPAETQGGDAETAAGAAQQD